MRDEDLVGVEHAVQTRDAILSERVVAYLQQLACNAPYFQIIASQNAICMTTPDFPQFNTLIVLLPCEPKASNHPKAIFC